MNEVQNKMEELTKNCINLANATLGAKILFTSDDFFASAERMLNPEEPIWKEDVYDDHGKWMDGWETRRKRFEGYDYSIIKLAKPGKIKIIDLYTRYFTGNYAPVCSVEVCSSETTPNNETKWIEIIPSSPLQGDSHNFFSLENDYSGTHLRLNIFPDGGIARLRVYDTDIDLPKDEISPVKRLTKTESNIDNHKDTINDNELIELSSYKNGGRARECSDEHFGEMHNLLKAGRGLNMGDGWETRRARKPNFDWVIISLGHTGIIEKIEIDTAHFKGNFPHQISINAAYLVNDCNKNLAPRSIFWKELLPPQPLKMDEQHFFEKEIIDLGSITHVRVNIYPDGGLSRVRFWGNICEAK